MKTSEFIRRVRTMGFNVYETGAGNNLSIYHDNWLVVEISKKIEFKINNFWNEFDKLDESQKASLMYLVIEYASTPIKEREIEKRYRLKYPMQFISPYKDVFLQVATYLSGGIDWYEGDGKSDNHVRIFTDGDICRLPDKFRKAVECGFFEKVEVK